MKRPRSGMAAIAVLAAIAACHSSNLARAEEPVARKVRLQLQITGVMPQGCVIEIRPGHPGCQFKPIARKVVGYESGETLRLDAIDVDVVSTGADHDASFAITIREPNLPARTYRRGVRLSPPPADQPTLAQGFNVYLNTPSLAARDVDGKVRR